MILRTAFPGRAWRSTGDASTTGARDPPKFRPGPGETPGTGRALFFFGRQHDVAAADVGVGAALGFHEVADGQLAELVVATLAELLTHRLDEVHGLQVLLAVVFLHDFVHRVRNLLYADLVHRLSLCWGVLQVQRPLVGFAGVPEVVDMVLGELDARELEEPRPADPLDPLAHALVLGGVHGVHVHTVLHRRDHLGPARRVVRDERDGQLREHGFVAGGSPPAPAPDGDGR